MKSFNMKKIILINEQQVWKTYKIEVEITDEQFSQLENEEIEAYEIFSEIPFDYWNENVSEETSESEENYFEYEEVK